jgi:hypothetical protein
MARLSAGTPLSDAARAALAGAEVGDGTVRLTRQLDRADYEQVNAVLERIAGGGRWLRKHGAHLYPPGRDPGPELRTVLAAGVLPPDPKRTEGWFATPKQLADGLAEQALAAGLRTVTVGALRVLEPSAGEGALADALVRLGADPQRIVCVEPDPWRAAVLRSKGYPTFETELQPWTIRNQHEPPFDLVLMNPPFTAPGAPLAWVRHVKLAWQQVAPAGRLVAVVPSSLEYRTDRPVAAFRAAARRYGGWRNLVEHAFLESGTGVRCLVLQMDRPAAEPASPMTPTQGNLFQEG